MLDASSTSMPKTILALGLPDYLRHTEQANLGSPAHSNLEWHHRERLWTELLPHNEQGNDSPFSRQTAALSAPRTSLNFKEFSTKVISLILFQNNLHCIWQCLFEHICVKVFWWGKFLVTENNLNTNVKDSLRDWEKEEILDLKPRKWVSFIFFIRYLD